MPCVYAILCNKTIKTTLQVGSTYSLCLIVDLLEYDAWPFNLVGTRMLVRYMRSSLVYMFELFKIQDCITVANPTPSLRFLGSSVRFCYTVKP